MGSKRKNRTAVILLSLIMVLTMMPSASFAAGTEQTTVNNEAAGASAGTDAGSNDAGMNAAGETDDNVSGGEQKENPEAIGDTVDENKNAQDEGTAEADKNAQAGDTVPEAVEAADVAAGEISDADVEKDAADEAAADITDEIQFSIPRVIITIDKGVSGTETGKAAIDAMNASEKHTYKCTGSMDILVPETADGSKFRYVDQPAGTELSDQKGISLEYMRGRGNTSWENEGKKPYKINLNKKRSLLGMDQNKHWALIANAYDPSLNRNRITYWLGRQLGMEFTPQAYPVDLFVGADEDGDGKADSCEYYGSYLLTHIPKNYVDIGQPKDPVAAGSESSVGYLMSMVQDSGSEDEFSTRKDESYQNINPAYDEDNMNDEMAEYIRSHMLEAEYSLYEGEIPAGRDEETGETIYKQLNYRDYYDTEAAAKYWLMQEFVLNCDAYGTGSTYLFKRPDSSDGTIGKIYWGPLWDFDYAYDYSNEEFGDDFLTDVGSLNALLYDKSEGSMYDYLLNTEWPRLRELLLNEALNDGGILDQYYEETRISQAEDYRIHGKEHPKDISGDYKGSVKVLKNWIRSRIDWMDDMMKNRIADISHKVTLKDDPEDRHPQVFYAVDGKFFNNNPDVPEKKGKIFLYWKVDDAADPDYGKNLNELGLIDRDISAVAEYISEEDATTVKNIFFAKDVDGVTLEDGIYSPSYTLLPDDAQDTRIKWTSSDESTATVNKDGTVNLHKAGEVTITAKVSGGATKSYRLVINSKKEMLTGLKLTKDTIYMKKGDVRKLMFSAIPENAPGSVYCVSDDEDVVFCDTNGVMTARAPGRTEVSVQISGSEAEGDGEGVHFEKTCTVIVTDDGSEGSLKTETKADGITAAAANLTEVAAALLTEEDRADLFGGADVRVWLEMKTLDEDKVPAADKTLILGYMDKYGLTAGKYIDISLFKKIGENDAEAVHDSKVPVKFTITIPEELKLKNAAADGTGFNEAGEKVTRTFYLLRVHDGKTECIAKGTGDKIECSSSHFSTYMLSYRDEKAGDEAVPVTDDDSDSGSSSSKTVKTGDNSFLLLWVAVLVLALLLGFIMLAIYRKNLDKKDEKDRE